MIFYDAASAERSDMTWNSSYSTNHIHGRFRCEDGNLMRHDPCHDDPYLETNVGQCPECGGKGCLNLDENEKGNCPDCDAPLTPDERPCANCRAYVDTLG